MPPTPRIICATIRARRPRRRYTLTVWPYHAMLGSIGHALVPAFEEAMFFHSIARRSQPSFQVKGDETLTEHYSALGPEVRDRPPGHVDRRHQPGTGPSPDGLRRRDRGRRGQEPLCRLDCAASAGWVARHDPALARKVYLLEDCTSPVVVPGVVDYTDAADAAFARFAQAGMHLVRATEPIEQWLEGIE